MEDERQRGVARNLQTFEFREGDVAKRELYGAYESLSRERAGDKAVGDARHLSRLKAADAPVDIQLSNEDFVRGYAGRAPIAAAASSSAGVPVQARTEDEKLLLQVAPTRQPGGFGAAKVGKAVSEPGVQTRFVGGRAFVMKTNSWIDSEIQKKTDAKRVRVQFDSAEYFDLLKNPQITSWLALGRNVQFVLGDTIYEIYE
jgi:hypothetical protein